MTQPAIYKNVRGLHSLEALKQIAHLYSVKNKKRPAIIIVGRGFHFHYYCHLAQYVSPEFTSDNIFFQGIEVLLSDSIEEYEVRMY